MGFGGLGFGVRESFGASGISSNRGSLVWSMFFGFSFKESAFFWGASEGFEDVGYVQSPQGSSNRSKNTPKTKAFEALKLTTLSVLALNPKPETLSFFGHIRKGMAFLPPLKSYSSALAPKPQAPLHFRFRV